MSAWRFALTKRWAGYLALTIVFAIVCSLLGMWQFARRAEAQVEIARIDANYDAAPVAIDDVLPKRESFDESKKWTQVLLEGTYLTDQQQLVRNRPFGGQPGFEIITPLLLDDGTVFIVDRGWIPTGATQDAPDRVPAAPSGPVTVTARLKAGEPEIAGRSVAEGSGQIPTIDLPLLASMLDSPVYTGAYGMVVSESPSVADMPAMAPRPVRDEGPHLSYALQWFVFALLAFVGLGWALRQEYRSVNADDPEEKERAAERERVRSARTPSDADVEDAILDRR